MKVAVIAALASAAAVAEACKCHGCKSTRVFGDGSMLVWGKRCEPGERAVVRIVNTKVSMTKFDLKVRDGYGKVYREWYKAKCVDFENTLIMDDENASVELRCRTCSFPGCNCEFDHKFHFGCMEANGNSASLPPCSFPTLLSPAGEMVEDSENATFFRVEELGQSHEEPQN
ncbi:MAG: hypothetical protein MHM6MM_007731 [Cercozoa sp. M6MM]